MTYNYYIAVFLHVLLNQQFLYEVLTPINLFRCSISQFILVSLFGVTGLVFRSPPFWYYRPRVSVPSFLVLQASCFVPLLFGITGLVFRPPPFWYYRPRVSFPSFLVLQASCFVPLLFGASINFSNLCEGSMLYTKLHKNTIILS